MITSHIEKLKCTGEPMKSFSVHHFSLKARPGRCVRCTGADYSLLAFLREKLWTEKIFIGSLYTSMFQVPMYIWCGLAILVCGLNSTSGMKINSAIFTFEHFQFWINFNAVRLSIVLQSVIAFCYELSFSCNSQGPRPTTA